MKLYKLARRDPRGCWDLHLEILVRAACARQARKLAHAKANELNELEDTDYHTDWLDPKETSCSQIKIEGKAEVIMTDFFSA